MASEAALLRAMSLTPRDELNDAVLSDRRSWDERRRFQREILSSTICEDKPEGPELFATVVSSTVPICHLMVPIALVSASIPAGNTDGTAKELAKEPILAKK